MFFFVSRGIHPGLGGGEPLEIGFKVEEGSEVLKGVSKEAYVKSCWRCLVRTSLKRKPTRLYEICWGFWGDCTLGSEKQSGLGELLGPAGY